MKRAFGKGLSILLLLVAIIGCDDLNTSTTEEADKTALQTAIDSANAAKSGVVASVDGTEVYTTVYWVTADQLNTFSTAISVAQTVYDTTTSDQTTVDTTKSTLESATTVFISQKQPGSKPEPVYTVFVLGAANVTGTNYYWEGSTKNIVTGFPGPNFSVYDAGVNGDDVYYVGDYWTEGGYPRAFFWKNGTKTDLTIPAGTDSSRALGITFSGSDVYILGLYFDNDTSGSTVCYWKNGTRTDIETSTEYTLGANDIFVSGSTVYITGYRYRTVEGVYTDTGCYWINTNRTDILQGYPHVIEKIGGDLYMAGSIGTSACYWKNDVQYSLSGGSGANVSSITIAGEDVYMAGGFEAAGTFKACYWKNGTKYELSGGVGNSNAADIVVIDNNVFVAGVINGSFDSVSGTTTATVCYWKNNTVNVLQQDMTNFGVVALSVQPE